MKRPGIAIAALFLTAGITRLSAQTQVGPLKPVGPGTRSALRKGGMPATNYVDYGNLVFLPGYDTELVGHGFAFDPVFGAWVIKEPVAHLNIVPDPGANPVSSTVTFEDFVSSDVSFESNEFDFDLKTTIGLAKIGASLEHNSSGGSQFRSNTFALNWINYYGLELSDYLSNPVDFFPEAQALINLEATNPSAAKAQWAAQFGTFVAVGYESLTSVRLKVSVAQSSSFNSTSLYASLKAQYATTSGSASFATLVENSFSNSSLSYSIDGVGVNVASLNLPFSADDIDTSAEKNAFLNSIGDLLSNSPSQRGLLLIPVSAFPGAVNASPSSMDGFIMNQAAVEANMALKALTRTEDFRRQANLFTFLSNQVPADLITNHQMLADLLQTDQAVIDALDGAPPSYGSFLDVGAVRTLIVFRALYRAILDYAADPSKGNLNSLIAETNSLRDIRVATEVLTAEIILYNSSILLSPPCVNIVFVNEHPWEPDVDPGAPSLFVLRANNLALFTNPWEDQDNIDFLVSSIQGNYDKTMPSDLGWFNLPLLPTNSIQQPPQGGMSQFSIDSFYRDPQDGLVDLQFRLVLGIDDNYDNLRLRLYDQFGRLFYYDYQRGVGGMVSNPPLGPLSTMSCP